MCSAEEEGDVRAGAVCVGVAQSVLLVLLGVFVRYQYTDDTRHEELIGLRETHVMVWVGLGLLMSAPRRLSLSALSLGALIAALSAQAALLTLGWLRMRNDHTIYLTEHAMLEAEVSAAAVLISWGAALGALSVPQLVMLALLAAPLSALTLYLTDDLLQVSDAGGVLCVHVFGATFGLAMGVGAQLHERTAVTSPADPAAPAAPVDTPGPPDLIESTYTSDVISMLGGVVLGALWPWFNAGGAMGRAAAARAVGGTWLAVGGGAVGALVAGGGGGRWTPWIAQNGLLAGGVAAGAVCALRAPPALSLGAGVVAGVAAALHHDYLATRIWALGVMDVCGVTAVHLMPGALSALLAAAVAATATADTYGPELPLVFPAMVKSAERSGRSASTQALMQLTALAATLAVAAVGGLAAGVVCRPRWLRWLRLRADRRYDDAVYFTRATHTH